MRKASTHLDQTWAPQKSSYPRTHVRKGAPFSPLASIQHVSKLFGFSSPGIQSPSTYPASAKHQSRLLDECTLAILMRSDVDPDDLPNDEVHSLVLRDVSSYEDIAHAAEAVYNICGKGLRVPGWAQIGKLCPKHVSHLTRLLRSG